jgi:hypothetical protein
MFCMVSQCENGAHCTLLWPCIWLERGDSCVAGLHYYCVLQPVHDRTKITAMCGGKVDVPGRAGGIFFDMSAYATDPVDLRT